MIEILIDWDKKYKITKWHYANKFKCNIFLENCRKHVEKS